MEYKLKRFHLQLKVKRIANIHYFEFTSHYKTQKNSHAFRELVYVDSGVVKVEAESYSGLLFKNQILIHKPQEIHSLESGSEDAPSVIIVGFECSAPELDIFSSTPFLLDDNQLKNLTDVVKEGRSVFLPPYDVPDTVDMKKRKTFPFGADQMIQLKLETLLIDLIRCSEDFEGRGAGASGSSNMREVHGYITTNFRENLSLDELSFLFSTNRTYLCREFKKIYGETIIHYINILRIKEAKKLLRAGEYNLTQIASMVGFSSIHYFSKVFKKLEGKTPSEYSMTIKTHLDL